MSEMASFDGLIARTVAEAERKQDQDITAVAQAGLQADVKCERSGDYENLLVSEVSQMYSQLRWLHEHPVRRRLMGRAAVQLVQGKDEGYAERGFLETPVLLEQTPVVGGDQVFRTGYVFSRALVNYTEPRIHVDQAVVDRNAGLSRRERLYDISLYSIDLGQRAHINGPEFTVFRKAKRQELLKAYCEANTWAKAFTINEGAWGDGEWIGDIYPPHDQSYLEEIPEDDRLYEGWRCEMKIEDEVPKLLKRGNGWDYPPEMFIGPLHLLKQANAELENKK